MCVCFVFCPDAFPDCKGGFEIYWLRLELTKVSLVLCPCTSGVENNKEMSTVLFNSVTIVRNDFNINS